MDRPALEARWLELTRRDLPTVAKEQGWQVHLDHCFQRILLDNACGGRWYDHVVGRPAYAHAPDTILREAVALGERALKGEVEMWRLDDSSLAWRGKPMKGDRRVSRARRQG